jgi:ectoine hydroxylase-related dioxygenase (phytanoyl-CoA dioxygenase family)
MLKPALHGSEHAFHQDASYWPMDPPTLVTVSIAIDESTRKNGCIKIIPESHVSELKQWGKIAVPPELKLPRSKNGNNQNEIYLPLLPGSALFFHSKLVHGSGPNKSIHPRNTALYTYFTPAVSYRPHNGTPSSRIFSVISGLKGAKFFEITAEKKQVQASENEIRLQNLKTYIFLFKRDAKLKTFLALPCVALDLLPQYPRS